MKRFTKICLILAAVLTVCGLGVTAAGYAGGAVRDIRSSAHTPAGKVETIDIPGTDLSLVDLQLTSEDVTIVPSQDGGLHVEYAPLMGREYQYDTENGTFLFTSRSAGSTRWLDHIRMDFSLDNDAGYVKVYLPENLDVSLTTTSGDTELRGITAGSVDISSTSGEITLSGLTAQALSASSTSGEIDLETSGISGSVSISGTSGDMDLSSSEIGGRLYCSTTAGEIDLESVTVQSQQAESVILATISGEISLESAVIQGGLGLSSTSGDISLEPSTVYGDISAETTSGGVHLNLVGAPAHRIASTATVSGSISVSGGDDGGQYAISVSTTSGDIYIRD